MKRNKILIICLLFLATISCKKVIDIEETDLIAGDVALKTVNNNQQAIIGAYAAMNVEMGILLNGVMSDELRAGEFYNAATAHEWQYGPADITLRDNFTAFPLYYRIIDRVNRVLKALPNVAAANATEEALKSRLKGEALFLRAFCHFELYRYYSNSSSSSDLALAYMESPSLEPQSRTTVGTYFTKLKADLATAKPLLPTAFSDLYRATAAAASGLQARVALYLKEYTDAVTYSTEYINALPLASRTAFPSIWTDGSTAEVAFKLSRTASLGTKIGSLYRNTSSNSSNIGTIAWFPSNKLWDSYDQTNDVRFSSYLKTEPLLPANRPDKKMVNKYSGGAYGTPTENVADAKVFRTGEMYLIRAEAKAELNNSTAADDLNALRAARINGYVNATFATKDLLIDAIMMERFKELPFEGHRFWDLKRRGLPVSRLSTDAPSANATTLAAGNFRFLLPIPKSEVDANPLIQQNAGYQ